MSGHVCGRLAKTVRRTRDRSMDESLRSHLEDCDECREAALVAAELAPLAAAAREIPPFADLYWRIQAGSILGESSRRHDRGVRPLRFFQGAVGIGMIAMALLFVFGPLIVQLPPDIAWVSPLVSLASAAVGGMALVSGVRGGGTYPELIRL